MTTNLVIVESKGKIDSITKYLNSSKELKSYGKFIVVACFGHIYELKKPGLNIDIDNGFLPTYQLIPDKKKTVDELKKKTQSVDNVYLASDKDAEGEMISKSLKDALKLKKYKRIVFTEITQKALEKAIKNPGLIDDKQVAAQETRRILDRLVGFKLSPLLWKKFTTDKKNSLSAGRVQSAALHIIINKESEINNFESIQYWNISGNFKLTVSKDKKELEDTKLYKDNTIQKFTKSEEVISLFKKLQNKFTINDVTSKLSKQNADMPFITSSLQQESYSKYGFTLKRTMALAQELYEAGLITYMRTDSYAMSDDFKILAQKYIIDTYSEKYYGGGKTKTAVKGSQEAHECIRVTNPSLLNIGDKFDKDTITLYEMIWKRTIGYLMSPCIYDELEINIIDPSFTKGQAFITTFKKVKFNGYLIIYGINNDTYNFTDYMEKLKTGNYTLAAESLFSKNIWSSPPQRFNESTIVKALEHEGIGRPSTYATIMTKLFERNYILKGNVEGIQKDVEHYKYVPLTNKITKEKDTVIVGAEKNKLIPTNTGIIIDKYLSENFDYIVDKNFTSLMEIDLDKIAEGYKKRNDVLDIFWDRFSKDLNKQTFADKTIIPKDIYTITFNNKDYTCRNGKFGPLLEFLNNDKKEFIGLKGYLAITKKTLKDVTKTDIKLLVKLPHTICKINNKNFEMHIGPYGLYGKYDNKNIKLPFNIIKKYLDNIELTEEDVKKLI